MNRAERRQQKKGNKPAAWSPNANTRQQVNKASARPQKGLVRHVSQEKGRGS